MKGALHTILPSVGCLRQKLRSLFLTAIFACSVCSQTVCFAQSEGRGGMQFLVEGREKAINTRQAYSRVWRKEDIARLTFVQRVQIYPSFAVLSSLVILLTLFFGLGIGNGSVYAAVFWVAYLFPDILVWIRVKAIYAPYVLFFFIVIRLFIKHEMSG